MQHTASILFWPILIYGIIVFILIGGMIAVSYLLGEHHKRPAKDEPYESGIKPTGSARLRYGIRYYLVGIFFILFDIEAAIVYAWAVAFMETGWTGYVEVTVFIITLAMGLVYIWKLGGLDWSPGSYRRNGNREE